MKARKLSCRRLCGLLTLSALLHACNESSSPADVEIPLMEAAHVIVEIDYMPGATPGMGPTSGTHNPWLIFERNLRTILPPNVEDFWYPTELGEMGPVDAESGSSFTQAEILSLAEAHQDKEPGPSEAHFHVLYFDGTYAEADADKKIPRAVHISGTRIIAMFGGAGNNANDFELLSEQSALLHEFGHGIGLVDLGVPDISGHSAGRGSGHCIVSRCVMGTTATVTEEMIEFAKNGDAPIIFRQKCLDDLDAYYQ